MTTLTPERFLALFKEGQSDPAPAPAAAPADPAAADFQAQLHREQEAEQEARWAAIDASREARPAPEPAMPEGMVDVTDAARRAGWHEPVFVSWATAGWLAEVVAASAGDVTMTDALTYLLTVALARAAASGGWSGAFFATDNAKRPRADAQSWRFAASTTAAGLDVRTPEGVPFRALFAGRICLSPLRCELKLVGEGEATP
jgi:hypothetical protein